MKIQQGDRFNYTATNGTEQTIEVTSDIGTHVSYRHLNGRSASGSVHIDYFEQLVQNGYFKAVE